jgi:hypothetical protein
MVDNSLGMSMLAFGAADGPPADRLAILRPTAGRRQAGRLKRERNCKIALIEPPRTPRFAKEYGKKLNHDGTGDTTQNEVEKKLEPPIDADERK